ncbi:MAG: hypothetical protein II056_03245 [Paludibacteraceae bacterium]|nr:hypothetical protein [Paludibacteraceae bacterium]
MIIVNVQHRSGTSKKTNKDYDAYVVHGLARGYNGVECTSVWVEPSCPGILELRPGDQVRIGSENGAHFIQQLNLSCAEELQLLLDKIL